MLWKVYGEYGRWASRLLTFVWSLAMCISKFRTLVYLVCRRCIPTILHEVLVCSIQCVQYLGRILPSAQGFREIADHMVVEIVLLLVYSTLRLVCVIRISVGLLHVHTPGSIDIRFVCSYIAYSSTSCYFYQNIFSLGSLHVLRWYSKSKWCFSADCSTRLIILKWAYIIAETKAHMAL